MALGSGPRRKPLHEVVYRAEQVADRVWSRFRPPPAQVNVVPFMGHGTTERVIFGGRVLSNPPVDAEVGRERILRRIRRMVGRFLTSEVTGVALDIRLGEATARALSDDEGYFRVELAPGPLDPDRLYHDVEVSVVDGGMSTVHVGRAQVMVPGERAERLVISDIDDTVLKTGAMKAVRMATTTLTGSAWTREPFAGVALLYAGLGRGPDLTADNPCFYVSSSPWNLYDFLSAFLMRAVLPTGPLYLKDLGVDEHRFIKGTHADHKRRAIDEILAIHRQPVVLVGDTGQEDPEIYRAVARDHPHRVEAVLLRHVADERRLDHVRQMFRDGAVPHALGPDSLDLCRAAEDMGLIAPHWSDRLPS
jgi:phosphatidate phosphatase APP1